MRVAAKIGFVAAGITGARRHEEIRRVIIQNSALVYGFTKGDRRQVFQKMFNKLHRIPGLESGALRQFLDRFMDALWKLRAGLRN